MLIKVYGWDTIKWMIVAPVLVFGFGTFAIADFQNGLNAHKQGDYATAFREFLALAETGHADSQAGLGVMYARGQGVAQDYAKAAKWYSKAAKQGNRIAQASLGSFYATGQGVPRDLVRSHMWFDRAASALPPGELRDRAVNNRDYVVGEQLSPVELYRSRIMVAVARGEHSEQEPIQIRVDLGKKDRVTRRFYPERLTFETGKLYKFVIHNPSRSKHYFSSYVFSKSVYTRKVQVMNDVGPDARAIAEIKGDIREIEVLPGGTVEWWLVPITRGTITDLHCHIKESQFGHAIPGQTEVTTHADFGMTGVIVIK